MLKKSTLLHLRIPFSLYLMPFFWFAVSQSPNLNWIHLVLSFLIIHLFFSPASNAYNSYYDKDEGSIGGLKSPPPVDKELLYTSLAMDIIALALSLIISLEYFLMLLIIGFASKAYSHPNIRLKKYPIAGLLIVAFFQGAWTYMMTYVSVGDSSLLSSLYNHKVLLVAGLTSLLLLGSYPMTQIYQHQEDGKRGDHTFSRMLGIRGTFFWTMFIFTIGTTGLVVYFYTYYSFMIATIFIGFMSPTLIYFNIWLLKVLKDKKHADYQSTMRLNGISSACFSSFFIFLTIYKYYF